MYNINLCVFSARHLRIPQCDMHQGNKKKWVSLSFSTESSKGPYGCSCLDCSACFTGTPAYLSLATKGLRSRVIRAVDKQI